MPYPYYQVNPYQTPWKYQLTESVSFENLIADIKNLIICKKCGPLLFFQFDANAGLPDEVLDLLQDITDKYCPDFIGVADLWALVANVAIEVMGGPVIKTRFGRGDEQNVKNCQLPGGEENAEHLRGIFHPLGFDDEAIVALSGAHTVGQCYIDRAGYEGPWTHDPHTWNVSFYRQLIGKHYEPWKSKKDKPQTWNRSSHTMMLLSDIALLDDPKFYKYVGIFADKPKEWDKSFTKAWVKLQELGCDNLRENL